MAKSRTKAHGVATGGPLASSGGNSTAAAPNSNSSGQFIPQQKSESNNKLKIVVIDLFIVWFVIRNLLFLFNSFQIIDQL
jgi:hypothetical protein